MATGLGMSTDEWAQLRNKVDESFWVMRVIGVYYAIFCVSFRGAYIDVHSMQGIPRFPTTMTDSRAEHIETTDV